MCNKEGLIPVADVGTSVLPAPTRRGPGRPAQVAGQQQQRSLVVEAPVLQDTLNLESALERFQLERSDRVRMFIAGRVCAALGVLGSNMSGLPSTPDELSALQRVLGDRLNFNAGGKVIPPFIDYLKTFGTEESS